MKKYYYKPFIWRFYDQGSFFSTDEDKNLEICIGTPKSGQIDCLVTKLIPERQFLGSEIMGLPLYTYETVFGNTKRKCAISDPALEIFRETYRDCDVLAVKDEEAKKQIFYYVYGPFNSKEYKELLRTSLKGSSFRIPLSSHFKEFEEAGEELATFHMGYETAPKYEGLLQVGKAEGEIGQMDLDKHEGTLTVNKHLSFENIPQKVFDYTINGKSPLEWLVNQYKGTADIDYVSDLIPRLVTVSVKTQEIVNSLPSIERIASMDSEIEKIWGK